MVHGPENPDLPTETLANRFQDLMRAFNEVDRARNNSGNRVLQREPVFGAPAIGDVASERARVNKLAVFEVGAGIDAYRLDGAVFTDQPRFVVLHDFAGAEPLENVFNHLTVVMKVDDVAADVLFALVPKQVEFGL